MFDAAEKCNCKPWELLDKPLVWTTWALQKIQVEGEVQKRRSKLNEKKGTGGRARPSGRK